MIRPSDDKTLNQRIIELFEVLSGRRYRRWVCIGLLLLFAMQIHSYWWRPAGDATSYLSMARSMAQTGKMTNLGSEKLYYAPGYPLLISPAYLFSGNPFLIVSLIHFCFAAVMLLGVLTWFRRHLDVPSAILLTVLVMVNVNLWRYYRQPLSETAFIAVWLIGLIAMEEVRRAGPPLRFVGWTAASVLSVALLCLIRHVGVFMAVGGSICYGIDALKHRLSWQRAIISSGVISLSAVVVVVSLIGYENDMSESVDGREGRTYLKQLMSQDDPVSTLMTGIHRRINTTGRLLLPGCFGNYAQDDDWADPTMLLYIPAAVIIVIGAYRQFKYGADIFVLTSPFYILIYLFWPYGQGARFFVPLLPLFVLFLRRFLEPFVRHRESVVMILIIGHLSVSVGQWVSALPKAAEADSTWPRLELLAEPVREHAEGGVACFELVEYARPMLSYLLDDYVREYQPGDRLPDDVMWLYIPTGTNPPPAFTPIMTAGDITLATKIR